MELKITKEKVLEAAAKCSTAKDTLQTLFPEAFEPEDTLAIKKGVYNNYFSKPLEEFCEEAFGDPRAIQISDGVSFPESMHRSLLVYNGYKVILKEKYGHTIIEIHKK